MTYEGEGEGDAEGQGGEGGSQALTILECDPPRRLVLQWASEPHWRVDLDLSVQDGRTVLLFTQVLAGPDGVGDVAAGWHWYLDKLDAELSGAPQPGDWETFFAEVGPGYGR
jgi:uncharacterized protein YndB with AHSA1/START domain